MTSLNKIIQGKKAKRNGDLFEDEFHRSAIKHGFSVIKIPSGCKQVSFGKIIRVKSPFDFVITKSGMCAFIDTKTTNSNTFGKSKVKPHQLQALLDQENQGLLAGYLIHFQNTNLVYFFKASIIYNEVKSLKQENGICIGALHAMSPEIIFNHV